MSMDRDLEFLYEIGTLRLIDRQWKRFLNPVAANLAEHHFRVIWLALIIAKHENAKNTEKILKMALVHDVSESRTGDVDYLSRQYVKRNEELGIKDILKDTVLEKEFVELWKEFDKLESIEAKIVKDADILDVDLEAKEQISQGVDVMQHLKDQRKFLHTQKLQTKTAKKIAKALQISNVHDWHLKGRNRQNAGDWKHKNFKKI